MDATRGVRSRSRVLKARNADASHIEGENPVERRTLDLLDLLARLPIEITRKSSDVVGPMSPLNCLSTGPGPVI